MGKRGGKKDAHSKTFPIKITIGKVYFYFCLCIIIYALLTPILTSILKHQGTRCKATITANESSWVHRWTSNNYLYEFNVGEKTYTGNSLIKVGNIKNWGFYRSIIF